METLFLNSADPPSKTFKILLVDDHPVFCLGMSELINKEKDLIVCGNRPDAAGALEAIEELQPDLVIIDISLKDSNGIDLVEQIACEYPKLLVLVLSMYDESLYAQRALFSGAKGYIMKQKAVEQVVEAIRQVIKGEIYASQNIKDQVFKQLIYPQKSDGISPLNSLTNRELEVFRLIGEGLSSKEIARRLHLSIKTIGTHRENIKEKLQLKHHTELIKVAVHWSDKIIR
jgi:DNA-binding NarL/FixJ family response regulator